MTNFILSWLSVVLFLLSAVIWPLRLVCMKRGFKGVQSLKVSWLFLKKMHIFLGLATMLVMFLHCRVAFGVSGKRSFLGGILLLCMLGLCVSGVLKRALPQYWIYIHRGITVLMFVVLVVHCFIEF